MSPHLPRPILEVTYEAAAQDYLRSLPPEHFMEATAQATQRKITLESLDLVKADRPDLHVFNELLVQYPLSPRRARGRKLGQIVPDNMAVLSNEPIQADTSFNVPLEPVGPFWVMEYVSKHNKRKDYEQSFDKYERGLKVPYYLLFYPDTQDLTLYRHNGRRYVTVKPNEHGRYPIPELELELALLDGWVRYWYKGKLLPLPADLRCELEEATRRAETEKRRADREKERADEMQHRAEAAERELAQLRARLERFQRPPSGAP